MYEIVAVLPAAAASCARAAARRPTPRSATASASPRSIRCAWTCCSSASCRASAPSRPTSTSTSSTSGAKRSSSTSTRVRPRPRGDGGERHPLPPALGGARRRQGARPPRDRARSRSPSCCRMYGARRRRDALARGRPRSEQRRVHRAPAAALPSEILEFPRHLSIHPGGFLLGHEPVARPRADRERHDGGPHRDPVGQGRRRGPRPVQGRPARPRRAAPARTSCFDLLRAAPRRRAVDGARSRRGRRDLRHDLHAPTRSACSRSRAARRCRCCRGSSPRTSTTSSIEVSIVRPGPITAAWCIRTCAGATARSRSSIRTRASSRCSRRRSACRCSRSR